MSRKTTERTPSAETPLLPSSRNNTYFTFGTTTLSTEEKLTASLKEKQREVATLNYHLHLDTNFLHSLEQRYEENEKNIEATEKDIDKATFREDLRHLKDLQHFKGVKQYYIGNRDALQQSIDSVKKTIDDYENKIEILTVDIEYINKQLGLPPTFKK